MGQPSATLSEEVDNYNDLKRKLSEGVLSE
jgi:hypothetical protein